MSNLAKGRDSYDSTSTGLVAFFNKNVTPYPTEVGGPAFDLVPVTKQKDIIINVARLHAQQEYNRILELIKVLEKQATNLKRRMEVTDAVHAAKYEFQVYHNKCYWLVWDTEKSITRLVMTGPNEWSTGAPESWQYMARVKWLGDYSWQEVDDEGNYVGS